MPRNPDASAYHRNRYGRLPSLPRARRWTLLPATIGALRFGETIVTRGVKLVARTRSTTDPRASASYTGSRNCCGRYDGWATYARRRRTWPEVPRSSRISFNSVRRRRGTTRIAVVVSG